jgi:hypothetical protein
MLHTDIIPEHNCRGELIELDDSSRRVQSMSGVLPVEPTSLLSLTQTG